MKKIITWIQNHAVFTVIAIYVIYFSASFLRWDLKSVYIITWVFLVVWFFPILQMIENERTWKKEKSWIYLFIVVSTFLWLYKITDLVNPKFSLIEPISCEVPYEVLDRFVCTWDCGGHKAWYEWACKKFNDATFYQCWGNSESFRQWCEWFQKMYLKR